MIFETEILRLFLQRFDKITTVSANTTFKFGLYCYATFFSVVFLFFQIMNFLRTVESDPEKSTGITATTQTIGYSTEGRELTLIKVSNILPTLTYFTDRLANDT